MSTTPNNGNGNNQGPNPNRQGGNGGDSGFNSIFQSAGGPPLILVCIAAGLLLGAFLGVLIMRRMRPTRAVLVHRVNGPHGPGDSPRLGEKPVLLDIHVMAGADGEVRGGRGEPEGKGNGSGGAAGGGGLASARDVDPWAHISPFAAVYLHPPNPDSDSQAPGMDAPTSTISHLRNRAKTLLARVHRPRTAHDPSSSIALSPISASATPPSPRAVQLAVTVLMPSPSAPRYMRPVSRPGSVRDSAHGHGGGAGGAQDGDGTLPDCVLGTRVVTFRPAADPIAT